jgi:hypothetical protein
MAKQLQIECYSALPPGEIGDLLHSMQHKEQFGFWSLSGVVAWSEAQ